jgi:outer membrane protein assembly factor BamB
MFRGGIAHTGLCVSAEPLAERMSVLWRRPGLNKGIHTASKSSPVADHQALYVGSDEGYIYALSKRTGGCLWRFKVRPCRYGIHGTPAVDADSVYIGAYDGFLYALDKRSGRLQWETRLGDHIGASPTLFEKRLYIGVETDHPGGFLACVDRATGELLFCSRDLGGHTHSTPTIDAARRLVYIGANSGWFYAFDADDGKLRWRFPTAGPIKSTAALEGDAVLFTSWDQCLYALHKTDGHLLWRYHTQARAMSSPAVDPTAGRVYAGSHDRRFYCVSRAHGLRRWRAVTGGRIMSSPVIASWGPQRCKAVLVGSNDGGLYLFDAATGAQLGRHRLNAKLTSVPLIANATVYVSTNRDLYALH